MAKQGGQFNFPNPPAPSFPVAIVPPEAPSIGGGMGDRADFREAFLKFMREAGEVLGRATAERINQDVRLVVEVVGDGGGAASPQPATSTPARKRTLAEMFAHNFRAGSALQPSAFSFGDGYKGVAAGVAGAVAGIAFNLISHAPQYATMQVESQRRLAQFSPDMAAVFNESRVRGIQRDLVSGERLAPSNRELLQRLDKFRDITAQFSDSWNEFKNGAFAELLGVVNRVGGPLADWLFGQRKQFEALPFVEKLQRFAAQEMVGERRRLMKDWGVKNDKEAMAGALLGMAGPMGVVGLDAAGAVGGAVRVVRGMVPGP